MNLKTDFKVNKDTLKEWSGVHGYIPDDETEAQVLGEMYVVLRVASDSKDFAVDKFAKIIVKSLQIAYFEELTNYRSTLQRLEEACWKMKGKIDLILSREEELASMGIDIEMAVLIFKPGFVYAVAIGESKIFIEREGKVVDISEGLVDSKQTGFVRSASLEVTGLDKFCIATSKSVKNTKAVEPALKELDISKLIDVDDKPGVSVMLIAEEDLWPQPVVEPEVEELPEVEHTPAEVVEVEEGEQPAAALATEDENQPETDLKTEEVDSLAKEDADKAEKVEKDSDTLKTATVTPTDKSDKSDLPEGPTLKDKLMDKFALFKAKTVLGFQKVSAQVQTSFAALKARLSKASPEDSALQTDEPTSKPKAAYTAPIKASKKAIDKVKSHFKDNQTTYAHFINTVLEKIHAAWFRVWASFQREIMGKPVDRRFVRSSDQVKRNRLIFAVLAVVSLFLIITVFNNARNAAEEQRLLEENTQMVEQLEQRFEQLNRQVSSNQISGGAETDSVLANMSSLRQDVLIQVEKGVFQSRLQNILTGIQEQEDLVLKITPVSNPEVIVDVAQQFSDSNLTDLEYSEGFLFMADSGRNVIYRVSTELNSTLEAFVSNVTNPYLLVKNVAGEIIVYDEDPDLVLGKFNPLNRNSLTRFPGLTPPVFGRAAAAAIFSGNDLLYEIRQNHQQIYRRDKLGDSYSPGGAVYQSENPPNWKTDAELANAIDIEVPFEVYVLVRDLGLRRYLAGGNNTLAQDNFVELSQQDFVSLQKATAMDVSTNFVVVADSINQRVLLFSIENTPQKNLKFIKQYKFRGEGNTFGNIKELKINEIDGRVYILDGARVLRVAL